MRTIPYLFALLVARSAAFGGLASQSATRHSRSTTSNNNSVTGILKSSIGYLENLSSSDPLPSSSWTTDDDTVASATSSSTIANPSSTLMQHMGGAAATEFEYVPLLSLDHADSIANHATSCCSRNGFQPVTVYVLDSFGNPIVSKRMDGCSPVGIPDIAKAKAYSCIVNKYPSRAFRDRYTTQEESAKFCQMTTMVAISGNQMAPFPGGILIKLGESIVGAVGVCGATGDEDEYCAIRGVIEANLDDRISTVPEKHSCGTIKDVL